MPSCATSWTNRDLFGFKSGFQNKNCNVEAVCKVTHFLARRDHQSGLTFNKMEA